jgi:hypothetical protein
MGSPVRRKSYGLFILHARQLQRLYMTKPDDRLRGDMHFSAGRQAESVIRHEKAFKISG